MLLPGLLFALMAKLGLEGDCISVIVCLVFKIQTHLMALSQKRAGCTGFWRVFHNGMRS